MHTQYRIALKQFRTVGWQLSLPVLSNNFYATNAADRSVYNLEPLVRVRYLVVHTIRPVFRLLCFKHSATADLMLLGPNFLP